MGEIRNVSVSNAQDVAFMKQFDADNNGRLAGDEVKALLKSAKIGGDSNGKLTYDQQEALEAGSTFQDKNLAQMVAWASDDPTTITFDLPGAAPLKVDAQFDDVGVHLMSSSWARSAGADGQSRSFSIQNGAGEKIRISFSTGSARPADGSNAGASSVDGVDPASVKNIHFSFEKLTGDTFIPDAAELETLAGELEAVVAKNSGKVTADQQISLDYAALIAKTIRQQAVKE